MVKKEMAPTTATTTEGFEKDNKTAKVTNKYV